jgi:hypothetical protein
MLIIMIDFAAKSSKFLAKCQEKTGVFVSIRLFPLIFYQSPPLPCLLKEVSARQRSPLFSI